MKNYSVIIAIYNRKDELYELLTSLSHQTYQQFEVIIVDDGSQEDLLPTVQQFENALTIRYFKKSNSGPGQTRNYGVRRATGDYVIFIDSDCIVPADHIEKIDAKLSKEPCDAFGGPDMAHASFNALQKAISYSMTSVLTTGGIRGNEAAVTKFQPRSFNMGVSREIFIKVGGFSLLRIGEDPDFSMTLWEQGYTTRFFSNCGVYHKRRSTLRSFARQVFEFGAARPILNQRHPQYTKLAFWFPSLFTFTLTICLLITLIYLGNQWFGITGYMNWLYPSFFVAGLGLYLIYFVVILIHATFLNRNLKVGILSTITSAIQLFCYGSGFLLSMVRLNLFNQRPENAFPKHFHKES